MTSPVAVLQGNIIYAFENPNGSAVQLLKEAVKDGVVSNTICMLLDETKPEAPKAVRPEDGPPFIRLHMSHMEVLWAFIYGWLVLYEECVQRPMMTGTFDGPILLDNALKHRAAALLSSASTLRQRYSAWPTTLPSPIHSESDDEHNYALKTTGIFQQSVAFLLFHEFGHLSQGHFNAVDQSDTREARATAIELEREADDFAFRTLISTDDDEPTLARKAWAILAAALSSLYLVDGLVNLFQRRHPHLHHRVADFLSKLNFHDQKNKDYYNYLCATVLLVMARAHDEEGVDAITPRMFDTALDALEAELDALDALEPGSVG